MDLSWIRVIIRHEDGTLIGYDRTGKVISKITEDGLGDIWSQHPDLVVLDAVKKTAEGPEPEKIQTLWAEPVKAVFTENQDLDQVPKFCDGTELFNGDLVLLAGQTQPRDNGIYRVKWNRWNACYYADALATPPPGTCTLATNGDLYCDSVWYYDGQAWLRMSAA